MRVLFKSVHLAEMPKVIHEKKRRRPRTGSWTLQCQEGEAVGQPAKGAEGATREAGEKPECLCSWRACCATHTAGSRKERRTCCEQLRGHHSHQCGLRATAGDSPLEESARRSRGRSGQRTAAREMQDGLSHGRVGRERQCRSVWPPEGPGGAGEAVMWQELLAHCREAPGRG